MLTEYLWPESRYPPALFCVSPHKTSQTNLLPHCATRPQLSHRFSNLRVSSCTQRDNGRVLSLSSRACNIRETAVMTNVIDTWRVTLLPPCIYTLQLLHIYVWRALSQCAEVIRVTRRRTLSLSLSPSQSLCKKSTPESFIFVE